jgi:bifunctional DNA-binding transcriptional regulator/antitoxin component of YhaV-PrlF toxin-antitoxin module
MDAALRPGRESLAQRIAFQDAAVLTSSAFTPDKNMDWTDVEISKRDLADVLNLSAANFSRHAPFLLGSDHHARSILMDDALALSRLYISTAEIAQILQVHPVAAHNLALYRGVKVVAKGLFDRASLLARIPEVSGGVENHPSDAEMINGEVRDGAFEFHAKVDEARMRLPAYVRMRMGLQDGDTVYFELIENGVIMRTAAQAVAHAQALASQYPAGGFEAFLAMRRKDSGD